MAFTFTLPHPAKRSSAAPSEAERLFFANVIDRSHGVEEKLRRSLYLVLAASQGEALQSIRRARLSPCEIEFRAHTLPVETAVRSYRLSPGEAHMVWPRDEAPAHADDYLFVHEPRCDEDRVLTAIMRGEPPEARPAS